MLGTANSITKLIHIAVVLAMVWIAVPSPLLAVASMEASPCQRFVCAATKRGSGVIKEYSDELSQECKGENGAHRMKEALAICKLQVNPIELWQLEDKEYTIRVAGKESAANQPGEGEDIWIDVVLPQLSDSEAKNKVKSWKFNWTSVEPHCFYLRQGSEAFEKQSNQGQIAVDEGKARFLGGMAGDSKWEELQAAGFSNYYFTIEDETFFKDVGIGDYLLGLIEVKHRAIEQTLNEDSNFAKAPFGGSSLFGNNGTLSITDDGPKPTLRPTSGLTGANAKFFVRYDPQFTASGEDSAVTGEGANQAAPILRWNNNTDFIVGGDRIGDTIVQVFPVFGSGPDLTAPILEIPIQVDLPILSEPGVYQLEVARRNLELRRNFSGSGDLEQEPTPIPPANGGTDDNWKLATSYTMDWGNTHATRTLNTDDLDAVFEFCQHLMAQIVPRAGGTAGNWHEPVAGPDSFFKVQPTQTDPQQAAYELALDQYRLMWNSGWVISDAAVSSRLDKSGPPLQQWLRFARHSKEGGTTDKRTDETMQRQRRFLEVKLKTYMDQAALARMKRYFSLRHDYRKDINGVVGITIDQTLRSVIAPNMPHQGLLLIDPELAWWIDVKNWFSDSFFHTGPLTRLFDTPMTPNWHVGHPFTEETINHMIAERASWVRRLLKDIDTAYSPGADDYPITVQVIESGVYSSILGPMSEIPLTHTCDANMRVEFRVPDRFWATEDTSGNAFTYPRFRDRSGTPVPQITLVYPPSGATGGIGKGSPNGFRLRVQHFADTSFDLDLRASSTSAKGTQAAAVIRLMHEIHVLETMLNDRAATIFWENVEAHMGKAGFLLFCVGDFFASTTDIYRTLWGRDIVTDQELTIEERLVSGMMAAVTTLTGGVPGSMAVNRGLKVLRKNLGKDVAATARANTNGISAEVAASIDDLADGGQTLASAANTARRATGRQTKLAATALENGLRRVNSILDLPITDLLKFHGGLGRMTESQVVRSGSQAPHINTLRSLDKSGGHPVPNARSVRATPTPARSDSLISATEDAAMANRIATAGKSGAVPEAKACGYLDGKIVQCFPAGTLVHMSDDTWRPIDQLARGDLVVSRSQHADTAPWTVRPIVATIVSSADRLIVVTIADSTGLESTISCTDEHPFWVRGHGWMSAKDLPAGATLGGGDDGLQVVRTTVRDGQIQVYNLEVDIDRTYVVASTPSRGPPCALWVHNDNCVLRRQAEAQIKSLAKNTGVQLTERQVIEAINALVERMSKYGGRGVLAQTGDITDQAIRKVVNRAILDNGPLVFVREPKEIVYGPITRSVAYESRATGAVTDVASRDRIVPALRFVNPNANGKGFVKFDAVDLDNPTILVDRKINVTTKSKQISDARRVHEAMRQNPGFTLRIEVPDPATKKAAERLYRAAGLLAGNGQILGGRIIIDIVP